MSEIRQNTGCDYSFQTHLQRMPLSGAVSRTSDAFNMIRCGVLLDVDVQAAIKGKMGIEVRPCQILSGCSPPLGNRARAPKQCEQTATHRSSFVLCTQSPFGGSRMNPIWLPPQWDCVSAWTVSAQCRSTERVPWQAEI